MNYLEDLRFSDSDIAYLESLGYHGAFLDYLRNFKLELTVRSAQEGDLVFANEPIVQVEGPLAQCQLVETALLNIVNYQTLVATKARNGCGHLGNTRSCDWWRQWNQQRACG
ncbi:nicotinate phosphoribosyltransferase [Streptococcus pneumoniae]|nr:nicotinate phosphoribosyltransferase [Streptococcus pneumoniae]